MLPDGKRRGYFIGDGTGVGKAREIVGIMYDNMRQGRKRHIWVTKKTTSYWKQAIKGLDARAPARMAKRSSEPQELETGRQNHIG